MYRDRHAPRLRISVNIVRPDFRIPSARSLCCANSRRDVALFITLVGSALLGHSMSRSRSIAARTTQDQFNVHDPNCTERPLLM